jgi:alcohol dehydrogenase (cytochrome c)
VSRGWLTAADADSGKISWKFESPAPVLAAVTPTASGVVFFGDMAGILYALNSDDGRKLWSRKFAGAIGGGIVSYAVKGKQRPRSGASRA